MNLIKVIKNVRDRHMQSMYERHLELLRKEASQIITIRNVKFDDDNVRPCILINDIVSYVAYEDDGNDIMSMMLHLRECYVKMFQHMPTIKAL